MLRSRQHLSVSLLRTDISLSLCVCLDMPHASQSFPSQAHHTYSYNPPQSQPTLCRSSHIYTVNSLLTSHKESVQRSGCFAYRFGWSLSILYYNLQLLYLFFLLNIYMTAYRMHNALLSLIRFFTSHTYINIKNQ